nr:CpaF family protein [Thermococcus sp. M36]
MNGEDDLLEKVLKKRPSGLKKKEPRQKREGEKKPGEPFSFFEGGGGVDLQEILSRPLPEETVENRPTGVELLGNILSKDVQKGGGTRGGEGAPSLESILGASSPKESPYAGQAKVLDAYGNVRILKVRGEPVPIYEIRLPRLTREEEELLRRIRERAITELQIDPLAFPDFEERRRVFMNAVKNMIREEAPQFSEGRVEVLADLIVQGMIGYGRLDPLVRDDNLEEIMVIGTNRPVYVWHRRFNMCKTNIVFPDDKEILNIIERIAREVGRRIDQQSPLLDARLPDGSRVNATIPPISLDGPTITIRKFKKDPLTIIDLIKYRTLNSDIAALLWVFVDGLGVKPANILVAGGTGSGKTTTLNALAMFIPPSERVISIEDTAELQLPVEHWIRLETRPPNLEGKGEVTMDDLVKNTLRMRPDRIIVGEVRGPEARTMFTAMNTGHDGCMGTIHSNSARETIVRLESPPMNVPRIMIPALDIILMQVRFHSRKMGTIRRVTEIAEISGMEGESIQLNKLYKYDPIKDELVPTGVPSRTLNMLAHFTGMSVSEIEYEKEKRKIVLEWMIKRGIRGIEKVGYYIRQFYIDEEGLMKKIEAESSIETSKQVKNLI